MLIIGSVEMHQPNETNRNVRPHRSCVMTKKKNDTYYVLLKNSVFPQPAKYRVIDIESVHDRFVAEGKLGLQFKSPRQLMLIKADDKRALQLFTRQIHDMIKGKNIAVAVRKMPKAVPSKRVVTNRFSPSNVEYVAIDNHFDSRILNMVNLSKLVLDNCTLSSMPEQIGNLPIEHLSLNNIRVPSTGLQSDRDMFWNWMCMDTITSTLKTLKMDNIGLNILPFELMYQKKLQTLSLANNNLKYLPYHIGNLKRLKNLNVSGNQLNYLPNALNHKNFHQLDISNNDFLTVDNFLCGCDHIYTYVGSLERIGLLPEGNVQTLRNLSFSTLFANGVKYKRQEIPRTLWHLYEVLFRCKYCKRLMLPTKVFLIHIFAAPFAKESLIKNYNTDNIMYQRIVCYCKMSLMQDN